jgi:amidase
MTLDALGQADAIRAGRTTASSVVEESIAAINALDAQIHAVVHPLFVSARRAAARVGEPDAASPPFSGVPILIKDILCHMAGDPHQAGMRLLRDRNWTATADTFLATRIRRAGFVVVGRSNAPELATSFTTEPEAFGATRNPWNLGHSSGGSSGGSAAAVAAGMVAVAHGNDMGGSIRVPASMCGVVGLKPTRGRISLGPDFGDYWAMLAHEGVLTRTVRDTASVLDAIAGGAPGDPCPAPPLTVPLVRAVDADPVALRIGVRTRIPVTGDAPHPDCLAAVDAVGQLLGAAGHEVCGVDVPALDDAALGDYFLDVFAVSVDRDLRRWEQRLGIGIGPEDVEARNWSLATRGRGVSATRYVEAVEYLQGYSRRVSTELTEVDLLLTPTLPEPPPRLGYLGPSPDLASVAHLGEFTAPFNVTGQPAVSIPAGFSAAGLPIGVQLVAPYGRDDLALAVAAQLERRIGWADQHPPASVWSTKVNVERPGHP